MKRLFAAVGLSLMILIVLSYVLITPVQAKDTLQQLITGTLMPTVTGTPSGVTATVRMDQENQINVRNGPSVFYDKVGVLLPGQVVPVIGRSAGGDWVLVSYPGITGSEGWVYAPYVTISPGDIPIVEPPPTPTPGLTSTIDATLAAQFVVTSVPTRMATFTEPAPLDIPTFTDATTSGTLTSGIPMGLIIIILGGLGLLLGIWSLIQGR
ncbi:MAG TPA: SH3 domain-containing protein [Longilinea sp.]|nr:SH3 domain-containing protein [Longilinea sp.]